MLRQPMKRLQAYVSAVSVDVDGVVGYFSRSKNVSCLSVFVRVSSIGYVQF
jgi:hypothetical protein